MRFNKLLLSSSLLAVAVAALPCRASTIQLGINGAAEVGPNYINFGNYPTDTVYTPAPGYGTFQVSQVNPGIFATAGVTNTEFGMIQSLNEGTGPVTLPSAFMTFDTGGSNLQLWANNIPAGGVGPFTLVDTANGAVASFNVDGYIFDSSTGMQTATFTGTFSATFNGETVAQLFSALPIATPFSATFSATTTPTGTPEPVTSMLLGVGLLGVGLVARRKSRAQS